MRVTPSVSVGRVGQCWVVAWATLVGNAYASDPRSDAEIAVVGLHAEGISAEAANAACNAIADKLAASGIGAVGPTDVRTRLVGRETFVLRTALQRAGDERMNEGRVLYERADFSGAAPAFQAAVVSYSETMSASRELKPLLEALTRLSMTQLALGDPKGARRTMAQLVALAPDRVPDPVTYPPAVTRLFQETRTSLLAGDRAAIRIEASHEPAEVWVDGVARGKAPVELVDLLPGAHYIQVTGAGGLRSLHRVGLAAGGSETWRAPLDERQLLEASDQESSRRSQMNALVQALGEHLATDFVLVGGVRSDELSLQLYEVPSGRYSKAVKVDAGDDVGASAAETVVVLAQYVDESGHLKTERMAPEVEAFDPTANRLLSDMLLSPASAVAAPEASTKLTAVVPGRDRGSKWVIWTSIGVAIAGASAAGAYYLMQPADDPNQGVIVVGPLP